MGRHENDWIILFLPVIIGSYFGVFPIFKKAMLFVELKPITLSFAGIDVTIKWFELFENIPC